ncbi:MAG: hypothetical protein MUD13_08960 [Candidatus Nanopelagicales bacterium]|nr:hypothetical protein [Candidatus Nanopelagicales bacterium]
MTTPAPRPALRRAADAHVHPADPSGTHRLRPAAASAAAAEAQPAPEAPEVPAPRRVSGPLTGITSDSLRAAGRRGRRPAADGKLVELTVQVPKQLRKQFRAALKEQHQQADDVVAALLRAWLDR